MAYELKAKDGMEKIFADVVELKANAENEKAKAHEEIEKSFEEKFAKIESIFEFCADKVEIPEEVSCENQVNEEVAPLTENV